jgi:CRISPR-associated protein Cmr5
MTTLQQNLAKQAYSHVSAVKSEHKDNKTFQQKYGTMALKLPILIRTAGLAQALAFVQARGSEAQNLLLEHLAVAAGIQGGDELARQSREEELDAYIYLTNLVLAALVWYKRFSESVLKVSAADADAETEPAAAGIAD